MTVALIAALVLTVVGFLVLLDRKDKRAVAERDRERRERADLLQRIQAPEAAVIQHQIEQVTEVPQPPATDDSYWEQDKEHRAAIAALEARENAPWDRVS